MPTGDEKVPNPEYLDLERLRQRVKVAADEIAAALGQPAHDLGSGKVWTGPVAEAFSQELAGRHRRLAQLAQSVLEEVDGQLRTTPQQCTRDEATAYLRMRRMGI